MFAWRLDFHRLHWIPWLTDNGSPVFLGFLGFLGLQTMAHWFSSASADSLAYRQLLIGFPWLSWIPGLTDNGSLVFLGFLGFLGFLSYP